MTAASDRTGTRLPRGTLDADTIADAALDAVAEVGVDAVTVPMVARRLGVRPTAVYWHFRRKEDLLQALDGRALEKFNALFPPLPTSSWQAGVRAYWTEYRRILRADPVLCELIIVRWAKTIHSPAAAVGHQRRMDGQVGVLLDAGFTPQQAARAYHALSTYTRGCLLNERSVATEHGAVGADGHAGLQRSFDRTTLPALYRTRKYWNATFATDEDFAAGLDLMLTGLEAQLDS
jgi:TetR/AcrR family transcriptional regulator, tetracycline repressor protein